MPDRYFEKFQVVEWDGRRVVDLTQRAKVLDRVRADPRAVYPYQLTAGQRPDQIARAYYDDPYRSWLVYFSAGTIDPFYDWCLTDEQLNARIVELYGSVEYAKKLVVSRRVSWRSDDRVLSTLAYEALPSTVRPYWEPVVSDSGRIVGYGRARLDWAVGSDVVKRVTVDDLDGEFLVDEVVEVRNNLGVDVGRVQVVSVEDGAIVCTHCTGDHETPGRTLVGLLSGATGTIGETTTLAETLPEEVRTYWEPLYAYDMEVERNEDMSTVSLVDRRLGQTASLDLRRALEP
jgi:hypothetical protein